MARDLPKGSKLPTIKKANVIVERMISQGSEGYVFEVRYNGNPMAAKIYKPTKLKSNFNPQEHYENLVTLVRKGTPSNHFLWPIDVIKPDGRTFGYVMPLCPKDYVKLGDILNVHKPVCFSNYRAVANACIELTSAFRILHNTGCCYQDLSDGNFFVNPKNGSVLICDVDNVSADGADNGILGTPPYIAPEIIRGESKPCIASDRFSLAVILFIMLTLHHPLFGSRFIDQPQTDDVLDKIYGYEPVFILDPHIRNNRPVNYQKSLLKRLWEELPAYLKQMFQEQFSKEILMSPQKRATEQNWQELFIRFRNDIIPCPKCGGESFERGVSRNPTCSNCGAKLPARLYMRSARIKYPIPLVRDALIFRSQFSVCNIEDAANPILWARANPNTPSELILTNISRNQLTLLRSGKPAVPVRPGDSIRVTGNSVIEAFNGSMEIVPK